MLAIMRVVPHNSPNSNNLDTAITLRDGDNNITGKPDIIFTIATYQKINQNTDDNTGDQILLPINRFFNTLNLVEQTILYDLYKFCSSTIASMTTDTRRELSAAMQERIQNTIFNLELVPKIIAFSHTPQFVYPDLSEAGTKAHHSPDKTFGDNDYVDITAISVLSKLMVPIWGEFITKIRDLNVDVNKTEKLAFELIEPTLDDGQFERIYQKLKKTLDRVTKEKRAGNDQKTIVGGVSSSYILTHSGVDDLMFNEIVMATIVVKRLATYECFVRNNQASLALNNGKGIPDVMVYIDNGIKRTVETRIQQMRQPMKTMPHKELPNHDTEDNQSILDHSSRTSRKPIDTPVTVVVTVENLELPRLLVETDTPMDVYESAVKYYARNSFDVHPLCQSMVASFIGTRFGGSKCLQYLPPLLYQKVVIMLQIWLIRHDFVDLATLITSQTEEPATENPYGVLTTRIDARFNSDEYVQRCETLFRGWIEKPQPVFGKKVKARDIKSERIDFKNTVTKLKDWLTGNLHLENTAPAVAALIPNNDYIANGANVRFDENIISNLCRFFLTFHDHKRPF